MDKRDLLREEVVYRGRDGNAADGEEDVVCFMHELSHRDPRPHMSPLERAVGTSRTVVFIGMVARGSTAEALQGLGDSGQHRAGQRSASESCFDSENFSEPGLALAPRGLSPLRVASSNDRGESSPHLAL